MPRTLRLLFCGLALISAAASGWSQSDESGRPSTVFIEPSAENFDAWKQHVLPTEKESAFEKIPWLSSFAEGLNKAREENRPFLFYAMNGHPLGCT